MIEPIEGECQCGKCKQCRPASMFSVDRHRRNGRHPYCNHCRQKYRPVARKHRSKWTDFADDAIRARYPEGGAKGCQSLLPDRTLLAIGQRAHLLGVAYRVTNSEGREIQLQASPIPLQEWAAEHRAWQAVRMPVYEASNFGTYRIVRDLGEMAA